MKTKEEIANKAIESVAEFIAISTGVPEPQDVPTIGGRDSIGRKDDLPDGTPDFAKSSKISKASYTDIEGVYEVEKESFESPRPRWVFEQGIVRPTWDLIVSKEDKVTGFSLITPESPRMGCIAAIATHPDMRGQGIGKRLLRESMDSMRENGFEKACLRVRPHNEVAKRMYERFGFEKSHVEENYYDNSDDAIFMEYDLSPKDNIAKSASQAIEDLSHDRKE